TNISWRYLGTVIAVAALLQITVSTADADILGQTPGTDFLAFEAEDADSIANADPTRGWLIVDSVNPIQTAFGSTVLAPNTTASRGTGLFDSRGNDPDNVTYKLQFVEPGTYSLYYRYTLFESSNPPDDGYGGEDSIYLGSDFGVVPTGGQDDPSNLRANHPTGGATPGDGRWEGNFEWWNVTITNEDPDSANNPSGTYTPTVNTVLDFSFGSRERGVVLDKLVFSLNGSLSDAELDALPTIALLPGDPGDFNLDGTVDLADYGLLTSNFSESFSITESFGKGDNNFDTKVDLLDFIEFRDIFNSQGQGVAGVPEPSGIALAGLALLTTIAVMRRKR
ncbi:MAG: hypothetical protein ACE1ZA_10800, partial [Pseudomonadales bacterium]